MEKIIYFSNWLYTHKVPILPRLLMNINRLIFSCSVSYKTKIGKGLKLGHSGLGVVIHQDALIGENCKIGTSVTIGGSKKNPIVPIIRNNVYIATGAKVLGQVIIGNNVVIAANSVVVSDIPDNCLVAGVPGRIIKRNIDISEYV